MANGVRITPYSEPSLVRFRALPEERKDEKINSFESYFRSCERAFNAGIGLVNSIAVLRSVLQDQGMRIADSAWGLLNDEDVIEVYRYDFTQLFRNLRFLEVCSYPLMDLYVHEWPELYRRPHVLTETTIAEFHQVLSNPHKQPVFSRVPDHFLEEIFSPCNHKFFIRHKVFQPVMNDQGAVVGILSSLEAKLLLPREIDVSNVTPLSL